MKSSFLPEGSLIEASKLERSAVAPKRTVTLTLPSSSLATVARCSGLSITTTAFRAAAEPLLLSRPEPFPGAPEAALASDSASSEHPSTMAARGPGDLVWVRTRFELGCRI